MGDVFLKEKLFIPVVEQEKLSHHFKDVLTLRGYEPARHMMEEIFSEFEDNDGNFLEQLQTTGFDPRIFELYMFAYFSRSGYEVFRNYDRPDFIVQKNGINVAIECTTVNKSSTLNSSTRNFEDLTHVEKLEKLNNELPIRFGSPLFSKLKKKYWELPHCKGLPLIIAIEAFYEEGSLLFSATSLTWYLYGLQQFPIRSQDGKLSVETLQISEHTVKEKTIPSGFFNQPDTEYISGVLFCNSGTVAKFNRMGYHNGFHRGNIIIARRGVCYDTDPNASMPKDFSYILGEDPVSETWGEGLTLCLNPNAKNPLPHDYFIDACQTYINNGELLSDTPYFHPFFSRTYSTYLERDDQLTNDVYIEWILKSEFDALIPPRPIHMELIQQEKEWYLTNDLKFSAVIISDRVDESWSYVILQNTGDQCYEFVDSKVDFPNIEVTREELYRALIERKL